MKLNLDLAAIDRSLAQDSLAAFVRQAWPVIEPTTPLRWNWHLDAICEHLEALAAGDIRHLLVNVMPRSGKSLLTSVFFPVWLWIKHSEERLVFASYAAALAVKLSVDRRAVIQSRWYQQRWGARVRLADDGNLKSEFQNTARGHMIATSVNASITGKGGNYVIADDLINPAMADSELEREGAIRWFDETLGSRLDDKQTGRVVIIEQRTHQADLTGHLLGQGGWTHLCLPAQFERRTVIVLPRSGREVVKEEGSLLWPEREGRTELDAAKTRLGAHAYQCQYLQAPIARGGNLFKLADLRRYAVAPARFDFVVQAWDCAFSTKASADYSACVTLGHVANRREDGTAPGYYLLHSYHGRIEFSRLKQLAVEFARTFVPDAVLIEAAASGLSLAQELQLDTDLPVQSVAPLGNKFHRADLAQPTVAAGQLLLPATDDPSIADFIAELTAFPGGAHDDFVDAFSMALDHLRHNSGARGFENIVSFYESQYAPDDGTENPLDELGVDANGRPDPNSTGYLIACGREETRRIEASRAEQTRPLLCATCGQLVNGPVRFEGKAAYHQSCWGALVARRTG